MSRIFSAQRPGELFGLSQGLALVGVILGALACAIIIHLLVPYLPAEIPVTAQKLVYVGIALLAIEFFLYWLTASSLCDNHLPTTAAGVGLALVFRFVLGFLVFLIVRIEGDVKHELLQGNIVQVLMIAAGIMALQFPFSNLLESRFGTAVLESLPSAPKHHAPQAKRGAAKKSQPQARFAFRSQDKLPSKPVHTIRRAPAPSGVALTPPDFFVKQGVAPNVHGTLTIPLDILVKSIPEARELFHNLPQLRMQLSYFVPQLVYPSAWFTWEQFVEGIDKRCLEGMEVELDQPNWHGRWIRIPSRVFVSQIPREHFFNRTPGARAWMKLPPVPQEEQFGTPCPIGSEN